MLREISLKPCDNFKDLCVCFNTRKFVLKEIMFSDYVKIDKNFQFST